MKTNVSCALQKQQKDRGETFIWRGLGVIKAKNEKYTTTLLLDVLEF